MRVRIKLAVDREPELLIQQFVIPLNALLQERGFGEVIRHVVDPIDRLLWVVVDVRLRGAGAFDCAMEFLTNADTPTGTVVYRRNWLGRKRDIFVLEPPRRETNVDGG
jgi:hypothetical protein